MKDKGAISRLIKEKRKENNLTQEEFALYSGLGIRFVRDLEQGKKNMNMEKVNKALAMFGYELGPVKKED